MAHLHVLPELVRDSHLEVSVEGHMTVHTAPLECRDSILPQYWETGEPLGRGGDGTVFLQQKTKGPGDMEILAVKQMILRSDLTSEDHDSRRYLRELEALAKFAQGRYARYFVRSYGWYQHRGMLYICMEYCKHLDLGNYLRNHETLSEDHARTIALQVSQGLRRMHDNEIAHRDLKPANILIHRRPPEDEEWWVVLGDLGLSRRSGASSGTTTIRGTPNFMAPETIGNQFAGNPADANLFSADMWCLGETIACALTGRGTFSDNEQLLRYQKYHIGFPDDNLKKSGASTLAIGFVRSLMEVDPSRRLTATQAIDHPWFMFDAVERTHTISSAVVTIDESKSRTAGKQMQAFTVKDLNDEAVVSDKREIPMLTQTTQASGQWTATVPIRTEDTRTSGMGTETVVLAATQKGHSPFHDRLMARKRIPEIVIASSNKEIGEPRVPGKIPPWNPNKLPRQDPIVERVPEQRDIADAGRDLPGSFARSRAGEKIPLSEKQREFARKNKVGQIEDLKKFSENLKLSTPVPSSLLSKKSNDEKKPRLNEACPKRDTPVYQPKIERHRQPHGIAPPQSSLYSSLHPPTIESWLHSISASSATQPKSQLWRKLSWKR